MYPAFWLTQMALLLYSGKALCDFQYCLNDYLLVKQQAMMVNTQWFFKIDRWKIGWAMAPYPPYGNTPGPNIIEGALMK